MTAADPLVALEDWVAPLIARLAPSERRALARKVGQDLRRSQATHRQSAESGRQRLRAAQGRQGAAAARAHSQGDVRQVEDCEAPAAAGR
jgi:hypothetical protein